MTVDELAATLGVTRTAVRSQLAKLERDGDVEQSGQRKGVSKPSRTYVVTSEAELLLSQAYIPILTQLLHVLSGRMPEGEFDITMREVGRRMMVGRAMPEGDLRNRVAAASALLNELGGLTEVEDATGCYVIRGRGCPLSAATARHPEACNALESLLSEFVGQPVMKCCDRYNRAACCFEVPQRIQVS